MSTKDSDPNEGLSPDAALAVEHTPAREAEQLSYFGGDVDDVDNFDPTGLDDGSDLDFKAPADDGEADDKDADDKDADDKDADDAEDDDKDDSTEDVEDADNDDADDPVVDDADADDADDADAEVDSEDADETNSKSPAKGIPKHRFDEVNNRRKAAEEENTRLKAQLEAGKPPEDQDEPFDIRGGEKAYMDLLLDGDTEGALAKREEIDAAKEAKWRATANTEVKSELSSDAETEELLALSTEAQTMFDVFDPDSDNYDQNILDKVMTFMRGYESTGEMTRGDSFVAALADAVEMFNLMPPEDDDGGKVDPAPIPTGKKKVDKSKPALRKKAHQPVAGEGSASTDAGAVVPSIENMTDEEIDALPEKTLARLRGDFI